MFASKKPYDSSRPSHYGRPHLGDALLEALKAGGKDIDNLTTDDLAPFENLHAGGRAATRNLARLAGLHPRARDLHVGCGIGGPVRTLAVEYSYHVTSVNITESYVDAGRLLTERVGLGDAVSLHVGSAFDLSYGDASFGVVWM